MAQIHSRNITQSLGLAIHMILLHSSTKRPESGFIRLEPDFMAAYLGMIRAKLRGNLGERSRE